MCEVYRILSILTLMSADIEFHRFIEENRFFMFLVFLTFTFFGIGTFWLGCLGGGSRFLLRFRGIKTTGTITRIERVHEYSGFSNNPVISGNRCFMTYQLNNGQFIESEWPVLQSFFNKNKKLGKEYTVYYNPKKTTEYECNAFLEGRFLCIVFILMGLLLVLFALFALLMFFYSFL